MVVLKLKFNFKFLPSHPMAGTEFSGYENSFAEMFNGAKWVITPVFQTPKEAREKLEKLIKEMGAEIVTTTPNDHDRAVALISHMPMVVSQALFLAASFNKTLLRYVLTVA